MYIHLVSDVPNSIILNLQETQNRNAIDNGEFNDLCTLSEVLDGIEAVKNEQVFMTSPGIK